MKCDTKDGEAYIYTPIKAIRRKCLDCCCGSTKEVELCPVTDCTLYAYRFGKRPGTIKREATPAQIERLRKARGVLQSGRISDSTLSEHSEIFAKGKNEG
jgi:hypothetical protein